jgi:ubiquinone/menaquinone biosynthesis C-methylase UbiE
MMHRKPLAYAAYQELADHYAAMIDTKPHNAYYDRPAMLQLWPNVHGKRCLDAGCGPGAYAEALLDRGAEVVAVDVSDRMLELAMQRVGNLATFRLMDLSTPGLDFADAEFDFINAPLCFDYIEDWDALLKECHRILKPHGLIQISCGHPAFEAEYYKTNRYFSIEAVQCTWKGFGKQVVMPSYRRSLADIINPFARQKFQILEVVEPLPTDEFRQADPIRYARLMHRPSFLMIQAQRIP